MYVNLVNVGTQIKRKRTGKDPKVGNIDITLLCKLDDQKLTI